MMFTDEREVMQKASQAIGNMTEATRQLGEATEGMAEAMSRIGLEFELSGNCTRQEFVDFIERIGRQVLAADALDNLGLDLNIPFFVLPAWAMPVIVGLALVMIGLMVGA